MGFRIPWVKPHLTGNEERFVIDALKSSWISGGPFVEKFEQGLREYLKTGHAICVSNGTTALHLALLGAGVQSDDEVIVPNYTFVAPGSMVVAVGARPVFADVDPRTWCISVEDVKKKISPRTKAVVAVHIYGNMASVIELREIADQYGIILIEDTAEAFGSQLFGKAAGTIGHIGTYSFHATKNITTGEGGLVVTDDLKIAERMRILRDHGMTPLRRYWHEEAGFNFRMPNMLAAFGCAQLESICQIVQDRKRLYESYCLGLRGIEGVRLQEKPEGCEPVIWTLGVYLDEKGFPVERDRIMTIFGEKGIEVRPGFYPFSVLPPYQKYLTPGSSFVTSTDVSKRVIALPFYIGLTEPEITEIVGCLNHARS